MSGGLEELGGAPQALRDREEETQSARPATEPSSSCPAYRDTWRRSDRLLSVTWDSQDSYPRALCKAHLRYPSVALPCFSQGIGGQCWWLKDLTNLTENSKQELRNDLQVYLFIKAKKASHFNRKNKNKKQTPQNKRTTRALLSSPFAWK